MKTRRVDEYVLAGMVRTGDIKGLSEAFQKAGDWDTREWVVVALQNMVINRIEYDKADMIEGLKEMIEVCEGERTGGTYRTNCLDMARRLLQKIGGGEKEEG